VESAPGAGQVKELTVEVSFDDGQSWQVVPVVGRSVLIWHPHQEGFVSLRATVADTTGNTVEQTIIRAYQIR
jgi:hypothetical protein